MKTPSDDLFVLIKSLSPSEKRYFKIFSGRHVVGEKNNYVRLFEAIDALKEYDETTIKKQFANTVFVKYFASEKKHLYATILEALLSYNKDISIDYELKKQLGKIEILFNKNLWSLCSKEVLQAKKTATTHEKYSVLLELLGWESKLIIRGNNVQRDNLRINSIQDEIGVILKKLNNLHFYQKIFNKIGSYLRDSGEARSKKVGTLFKKMVEQPLLKNENLILSKRAKIYYYQIFQFYYQKIEENTTKSSIYSDKLLHFISNSPELIQENPNRYIVAIYIKGLTSVHQKKEQDVKDAINKLNSVAHDLPKGGRENILKHIFLLRFTLESDWHIQTGRFDKGVALIRKNEEQLKPLSKLLNTSNAIVIYYNIAYIYFGYGMYKKALEFLYKLLNTSSFIVQKDIEIISRILLLIIHFELKNEELLNYSVKSLYRFLYKKEKLYAMEETILNFIQKRIPKAVSKSQLIESFIELKKDFIKITKNPYEKKSSIISTSLVGSRVRLRKNLSLKLLQKKDCPVIFKFQKRN